MAGRKKRGSGKKGDRKLYFDFLLFFGLLLAVASVFAGRRYFTVKKSSTLSTLPLKKAGKSEALKALEELLGPLDPAGVFLTVPDRKSAEKYLEKLTALSRRKGDVFSIEQTSIAEEGMSFAIAIGADEAMPLGFKWPSIKSPLHFPRLAIIIDDMGRSLAQARELIEMDAPVALAVLPGMAHSREVAQMTVDAGREVLLHLPMQPLNYPQINPGPNALLEEMDESTIRRLVSLHLNSLPMVSGVNNHMGSRLTELKPQMEWVMDELGRRDLYFLDSLTSRKSEAAETAKKAGIGWARRDIFLDNVVEGEAIGKQLEKAIEQAKKKGRAVAIGHPHPATMKTLKTWIPLMRKAGVQIVPLGDLISHGDGV